MRAFGEHDELGFVFGALRGAALDGVVLAQHERVERDAVPERVERTRVGDEHARRAGGAQRVDVAGGEVHGIHLRESRPRQLCVAAERLEPLAERRDRALAPIVDERDSTSRRDGARGRFHAHTELLQTIERAPPGFVLAERRDEQRIAGQARELHGSDGAAAGRLLEGVLSVDHLAGLRHVLDARELHPLDVADRGDTRTSRWRLLVAVSLHARQSHTLQIAADVQRVGCADVLAAARRRARAARSAAHAEPPG